VEHHPELKEMVEEQVVWAEMRLLMQHLVAVVVPQVILETEAQAHKQVTQFVTDLLEMEEVQVVGL
jgi:hypothetical protein